MINPIGQSGFFDGCCRIPATDNGHGFAVSDGFSHGIGSFGKLIKFKNTHGTIPDHQLGLFHNRLVPFSCFGADIDRFHVFGNLINIHCFHRGRIGAEFIDNHHIHRQFKADSRLFYAPEADRRDQSEMLQTMIGTMLERASEEMRNLIAESDGKDAIQEQGVFSHVEIRTDRQHGGKIRERLLTLLKSLEDPPAGGKKPAAKPTPARKRGGKSGEVAYRLTIAFYPIAPGE